MTRTPSSLFAALLAPIGSARFFAWHWQKRMLDLQLAAKDFSGIADAVGALDVERLAGLARGGVQAWIANERIAHSVLPVDSAGAAKAMGVGATVYFVDVPLDGLTHDLAAFLGTRPQNIMASLFLTPGGSGAAWHFDANENFTIQLTGAKRWAVAQAPCIPAAPDSYVPGLHVPGSLVGLMGPLDKEPAHHVELVPGSLLYVPRGTLHRTEADAPSWSLNLSYGRTMWLDLVCAGLRDRLAASEKWRGSVTGVAADSDPAARGENILGPLLQDLRALLDEPGEVEDLSRRFLQRVELGP